MLHEIPFLFSARLGGNLGLTARDGVNSCEFSEKILVAPNSNSTIFIAVP